MSESATNAIDKDDECITNEQNLPDDVR